MKKILIFQLEIAGHALEYINHLYSWAQQEPTFTFVFCITQNKLTKKFFYSSNNNNIQFVPIEEFNRDVSCREKCGILRKQIIIHKPTDVVLLSFDQYFPFFHFMLPRNVHYTSFLYYLYVYNWHELNFKSKIKKIGNYWLLFKNKAVSNILICNGTNESIYFNRMFNTKKFVNIVDPIAFDVQSPMIKKNNGKITFLHMGTMDMRKGTLEILDAILGMPEQVLSKMKFIFMGKISNNIKDLFYSKANLAKKKTDMLIVDEFCSYEQIQQACCDSTYLLMPYHGTSQSSGMLAYASAFNIPVVATDKGMLKKLVKKYKLGYLVDSDVDSIRSFLLDSLHRKPYHISRDYVERNSVANFINTFHKLFV